VPEGASSLLMPRSMGHQRAFAALVIGTPDEAPRDAPHRRLRQRGGGATFAPTTEARKVAREICALPTEAVAISRKLLKLPPEDLTRRIDQESHLFGERMRSKESDAPRSRRSFRGSGVERDSFTEFSPSAVSLHLSRWERVGFALAIRVRG